DRRQNLPQGTMPATFGECPEPGRIRQRTGRQSHGIDQDEWSRVSQCRPPNLTWRSCATTRTAHHTNPKRQRGGFTLDTPKPPSIALVEVAPVAKPKAIRTRQRLPRHRVVRKGRDASALSFPLCGHCHSSLVR